MMVKASASEPKDSRGISVDCQIKIKQIRAMIKNNDSPYSKRPKLVG